MVTTPTVLVITPDKVIARWISSYEPDLHTEFVLAKVLTTRLQMGGTMVPSSHERIGADKWKFLPILVDAVVKLTAGTVGDVRPADAVGVHTWPTGTPGPISTAMLTAEPGVPGNTETVARFAAYRVTSTGSPAAMQTMSLT